MEEQRILGPNIYRIIDVENRAPIETYKGLAIVGLNKGENNKKNIQPYFGSPIAIARVVQIKEDGRSFFTLDGDSKYRLGDSAKPRIKFIKYPLTSLTVRDISGTGILCGSEIVNYNGSFNRRRRFANHGLAECNINITHEGFSGHWITSSFDGDFTCNKEGGLEVFADFVKDYITPKDLKDELEKWKEEGR